VSNRPPIQDGRWIFKVKVACCGIGCDRDFFTTDPTRKFCSNCRRRDDFVQSRQKEIPGTGKKINPNIFNALDNFDKQKKFNDFAEANKRQGISFEEAVWTILKRQEFELTLLREEVEEWN